MKISHMLKTRPRLNTVLGIAFSILASVLLLGYISHLIKTSRGGPLLVIPVAKRDIEIGAVISSDSLTFRKVPRRYMVPGTIKRSDYITGNAALRFIGKGEPFTSYSISGRNNKATLAARIPAELRAYTIELGGTPGSGMRLHPGDRVDVLATSGDPPKTGTILRNKLVLSYGDQHGATEEETGERGDALRITVLVSPAEAELLAQAEHEGEISLSLCPLSIEKD